MSPKRGITACEMLLSHNRLLLNDVNSILTNFGPKRWLLTCNANSNSYSMRNNQFSIQSKCQRGPLTSVLRPIHTAEFVNFQKYVLHLIPCTQFFLLLQKIDSARDFFPVKSISNFGLEIVHLF